MCERIKMADGSVVIMCGGHGRSRRRRPLCGWCGRQTSTKLCDGPKSGRKTCDLPLCEQCAVKDGAIDYCPRCAERQGVKRASDATV